MDIQRTIDSAVSYISRKNPGIDKDDLEQIAWVYVLEHKEKIEKWKELDEPAKTEWYLRREINNVLVRHIKKEKAAAGGFEPQDISYYGMRKIAQYLPFVMINDQQPPITEQPEIRSGGDPAHGGDWLAGWLDVEKAWTTTTLSENESAILWMVYHQGLGQQAIAEELGLAQSTVSDGHKRALRKLSEALGGPNEDKGCPYDCECHEGKLRARPGARGNGSQQMLS